MKQLPVRYGPKKIGQKAFDEQQAMKQFEGRQGTVYGKRKAGKNAKPVLLKHTDPDRETVAPPVGSATGDGPEEGKQLPAPETPSGTTEESSGSNPFVDGKGSVVTISAMGDILEAQPELLDVAIETELAQAEPRKGAVELLQKTERARPAGERESVLELLGKLA